MRRGFTLIELLVVIAIIAIMAVVVVLALNPAELLRQSRDANRLSDLATLQSAIGLYQTDLGGAPSMGSSSAAYVSLPDASSSCASWGLPASSSCASSTSMRNIDSTGWIPLNFKLISAGAPLSVLPVDPVNSSSSGLFYTYSFLGGSQFELIAPLESQKERRAISGALGPGIATAGSSATPSLLGYWPMDEGMGSTTADMSGNGNVGSLINGAMWTGGKVGADAVVFPGFVTVSDSPSININDNLSIAFWIKDGGTTTTYAGIISKANYGVSGYMVTRSNSTAGIYVRIDTSGGSNQSIGIIPNVLDGAWHHIVFILSGGNRIGYKDGAFVFLNTYNAGSGFAALTHPLYIGDTNLVGSMDDVRIYNRALSAAEIQALYNAEH